MSSALHDQLSRLAEEVSPSPDAAPGRDLWERGARYRRRLRAGTAIIVAGAAVLLAVLTGASLRAAGPLPEPAPVDAPSGLPSRIHTPSPWLPGTDEAGPPGRTVALVHADRGGWWGARSGEVAVSAAGGDYRFLDLPDAAEYEEVALSPDGLRVAFWTTGATSGTPNTSVAGGVPVTGVAVYDLVSGDVVRHAFPTGHGLRPTSLAWLDATGVVVAHSQFVAGDDASEMDQASSDEPTTWRWDVAGAEPARWPEVEELDADTWGVPANGRTVAASGHRLNVLDGTTVGSTVRGVQLSSGSGHALSPDGTRVAGAWDGTRIPNDAAVFTTSGEGKRTRLRDSPRTYHVDGWRDDEHVVLTRRSGTGRPGQPLATAVYAVDVSSGTSERLIDLPGGPFGYRPIQWAPDLLDSPVVDRPAPPTPLDPRLVTGLAVTTLLAAGLALWRWRRRVSP